MSNTKKKNNKKNVTYVYKKNSKPQIKKRQLEKKEVKSITKIEDNLYNKDDVLEKNLTEVKKEINSVNEESNTIELLNYKDYKGLKKVKAFFINRYRVRTDDMKKFKKKLKYGTLKDKILIIVMMVLIALVTVAILFCGYIVISAPSITNERLYKNNSTVIYDAHGNEIVRLGTENREKVTYDELPEVLIDAIIATEDSRYFQHNGVDVARFTKAVIGQLLGNSDAGGASTITMQVSKNAATSNESSGLKGIIRKFQDVYLSVFVFEKKYTKEQILEFYVNIPNLGAGSYGVQQASQIYFGKDVSELSLTEAAMIAGLFQAPSTYNPYNNPDKATKRRETVLKLMYKHGYITKEQMEEANNVDIESLLVGKGSLINENQGFIDTVVAEVRERTGTDPYNTSMEIYSTMVPEKQDVINKVNSGETFTWKNDYVQAASVVIDNKTGAMIAVGAGRNKTSELSFNYATEGRRHPGSTAKPIIDYGPAIEYLGWGSGQTIVDDQMTYTGGHSIKNFDNGFKEIQTIKQALGQSRNIPALETFLLTTNEQKLSFATNLGWRPETDITGENLKAKKPTDIKGTILESGSIGGFNGVTPLEAAAAYATFARGGVYIEPYSFTKIVYTESGNTYEVQPEQKRVMSEETAYIINMILKYAVTSGNVVAGSVSGTDLCGKTGTSTMEQATINKYKLKNNPVLDAWENTYTPDYTISLWYGYPEVNSEHYLTNNEGNVEKRRMVKILNNGIFEKNSRFKKPKNVVTVEIELETDPVQLASPGTPEKLRSTEYYKKGTEPTTVSTRFTALSNPSNLRYVSTDNTVTLAWNAAPIPDAINNEVLTKFFTESVIYNRWAEKYLQKRLAYNAETFGTFGYRIYLKNGDNYQDVGFTTNTSITLPLTGSQTYLVKTSYEKFISNMSNGLTIDVSPNSGTTTDPSSGDNNNKTTTKAFSLVPEYKGPSCSTAKNWNDLGPNLKDKFKVSKIADGITTDVTSASIIQCTIFDENDQIVTSVENGKQYEVNCSIIYEGKNLPKNITIRKIC